MHNKPRFYTILIIPDTEGRTVQFKIRSFTLKIIIFTMFIFIAGGITGIILSGRIAAKIQLIDFLARQNEQLKEKNEKIEVLSKRMTAIKNKENKIRLLASTFLGKDVLTAEKESKINKREDAVDAFVSGVRHKQKVMELFEDDGGVSRQTRMLVAVPTLRPLDGWITKGFNADTSGKGLVGGGHTGVDIAAATGTPIAAAAPGIVTYAGWHTFFGDGTFKAIFPIRKNITGIRRFRFIFQCYVPRI